MHMFNQQYFLMHCIPSVPLCDEPFGFLPGGLQQTELPQYLTSQLCIFLGQLMALVPQPLLLVLVRL